MTDPIQKEVEDIADKTRVVPVTMMFAVAVALVLLTTFAISVYHDSEDGTLHDPEGIVNEDTMATMKDVSPIE